MRTLTLKSKLGFGKYHVNTVNEVLEIFKSKEYLRWVYYNMSHISFMPEILKEIDVIFKIDKPGKNPELFCKDNIEYQKLNIKDASILKRKGLKAKKRKLYQSNSFNSISKSKLQSINQNKF